MANFVTSIVVVLGNEVVKNASKNQRLGRPCWNFLWKTTLLLEDLVEDFWKVYWFTYSSYGEQVGKILADQRSGHPSWMSNRFKKKQHFFMTIRGKIVVRFVTGNAHGQSEEDIEYVKSWRHTDGQTAWRWTPFNQINPAKPLAHVS